MSEHIDIQKHLLEVDNAVVDAFRNTHNNIVVTQLRKLLLKKYYVNPYPTETSRLHIISYSDFITRMSLHMNGAMQLFNSCIFFGDFIYDIMHGNDITNHDIHVVPIENFDMSNIRKYLHYDYETIKYVSFTYHDVHYIIHKNTCIDVCDILLDYCERRNNGICFDGIDVYMHPMKYVYEISFGGVDVCPYMFTEKYEETRSIFRNILVSTDITKYRTIIFDELIPLMKSISQNSTNEKFCKYVSHTIYAMIIGTQFGRKNDAILQHVVQTLISNNICPRKKNIYDAIAAYDTWFIDVIVRSEHDLDILNSNGLSPIEYAIELYKQSAQHLGQKMVSDNIRIQCIGMLKKIILSLNTRKYTRNPKWFDHISGTKLYTVTNVTATDTEIRKYIDSSHEHETDIVWINRHILRGLMNTMPVVDINTFVKHNIKYIDLPYFINDAITVGKFEIFAQMDEWCPDIIVTIGTYMRMHEYNKILHIIKTKPNVIDDKTTYHILNDLIRRLDYKSIVFLFEYINRSFATIQFSNGDTLLHRMCSFCENCDYTDELRKCAIVLFEYCAESINIRNDAGFAPIFLACHNTFLIELFIDHQCDLSMVDNDGNTCLHEIIKNGDSNTLSKILTHGILQNYDIIDKTNNFHQTPLILACILGKQDMSNILIKHGADKNIADNAGNTMYHYVCINGLSYVNVDAIPEIENYQHITPTDCAIKFMCS